MKHITQDFTQGSIWKKIIIFSLPLMLSNVLQVLFNMADIAVAGKFAGDTALGSVGSTATLVTLYTAFLIGLANGVNVLAARYFGAKDDEDLSKTVHTSAILCTIIGVIILLLGLFTSRPMLELLNTKPELIEDATLYLKIYFLGMPAMAIYNYGNAVLSASGDTKRPLLYLTIAGVLNVALNLFFVIVCRMGVAGVAIASIISQYLAAGLTMSTLLRSKEAYALKAEKLRISRSHARQILGIGIPAGFQHAIFVIANLFIQGAVNSFDAITVAGTSAAANADGIVYDVMAAIYTACGCFIGQNYGAGNRARMRKSYIISIIYSFAAGALLSAVLALFGTPFLMLFTRDPAVAEAGMHRLIIMCCSYAVSSFMDCTISAARGLGKSLMPTVIVILGACVFRVIWIYTVFDYFKTLESLFSLYLFSWIITSIAEMLYFRYVFKRLSLTFS